MKICYIKEMHETCDFVKRILIKIKKLFNIVEFSEDKGKTTIILPLFKSNIIKDKKIIKIAKKINRKLYDNNIENVVLSNYLEENEILKQKLYCQNINILDGRYLFYLLIPEIVDYILKRQKKKLENGEITLLINDFTENNARIITYIAQSVKRVNIVTNHSNKFKKLEEYLYNELGIILNITNIFCSDTFIKFSLIFYDRIRRGFYLYYSFFGQTDRTPSATNSFNFLSVPHNKYFHTSLIDNL